MKIYNRREAEDVPAGPAYGLKRPTFGLSREAIHRVELVLAMRGGGVMSVLTDLGDEITEERLGDFSKELATQIAASETRSFSDAWSATGQRAWVNLGEVVAFSVRQAK